MKIEVTVTRRVIDGDEVGPCEYVLSTPHPNGEHTITNQNPDPGKAFKHLLCDLAVERLAHEGIDQ